MGSGINVVGGATDLGVTSAIGGSGALTKLGTGVLTLHGYAGGTTITAGTLQLGAGAGGSATGSILGNVANNGALAFNRNNTYVFGGTVSGMGSVTQQGNGATVLTADNTHRRHHDLGGHVAVGRGRRDGQHRGQREQQWHAGLQPRRHLRLRRVVSGSGAVAQRARGHGVQRQQQLHGRDHGISGQPVHRRRPDGRDRGHHRDRRPAGGKGVIGGDVTLAGNSTLSPGANGAEPGTLTIKGNLTLGSGTALDYSFGEVNVAGGALNDLIVVDGDVSLGGKLNVALSPGGNLDVGVYRVINYGGALSNPAG